MTSKYANLNLPPLEDPNPKHKEMVQEAAEKITSTTPAGLARLYLNMREKKEVVDDELKSIQVVLDAVILKLISAYEEQGITSVKLEGGATVSTQPEPICKVTDKDAIRQWAIEQGMERELNLHVSTLNSLVKGLLMEGKSEPPGVEAFMRTKIVRRNNG